MASPGDIIRVALAFSQPNASLINNVFLYENQDACTNPDLLDAVVNWVVSEFAPEWAAIAATTASLVSVAVDCILPNGHVDYNIGSDLIEEPGTQSGDVTEAGSSFNLTAYTAIPKCRGRKFFAGLSDSNVAAGLLDANVLVALASLALAYLNTITGAGDVTLVPGVRRTLAEEFQRFNGSVLFGDVPRSQRRRQPDVGA